MKKLAALLSVFLGLTSSVQALQVTPASGGTSISADTAANSPTAAWTDLGAITLSETKNGHRRHFVPGTDRTFVLKAPTGFQFNSAQVPSVSFTEGRNITTASAGFQDGTTLVVTLTIVGQNQADTLVIGATTALQVQPTSTAPLASGNIYRPSGTAGGTAIIKGVTKTLSLNGSGGTSFGRLVETTGVPTQLTMVVQPSANAVVNTVFGRQPSVAVADGAGNVKTNVNGVVITAVRAGGSGNLLGTTTAVTVNGVATFTDLAADTVSTITIGFSADGLNPVTSSEVNVTAIRDPSVPTSLVIKTQPSATSVAGVPFATEPVIQVNDQYDNLYTNTAGLMITAARVAGNGDLQGTTAIEAIEGVASFSGLFHTVANEITIGFSATGLVSAVSQTVTVSPAAADRLAFQTQPGSATAGTPFGVQPVVVTQDAFGNASVVGLPLSLPLNLSLHSGTGTLSGVTSDDLGTDDGNGEAVFSDLQINLIGDKQLLAVATDFLSATSVVFTVTDLNQTIDFAELDDKTFGNPPFEVTATASSGLPVQFSVFSGPATISNNLVTLTGAGSVTIRASQPGNGTFAAAPDVDQTFDVFKADQTISFDVLAGKTFGDAPFAISATASSDLEVGFQISGPATLSNGTITITGAGTVVVTASQPGDDNYNAALDVERSFEVSKANQTISFAELADKYVNDAPFEVSATASSQLPVSFSIVSGSATITNGIITITGAGEVVVSASQSGNENFNAAPAVSQNFDVLKIAQTITFAPLSGKTYGDPSFELAATSSSQLPVSFSVLSGPATISNNTLTITGAGEVIVRASQAGNEQIAAAPNVDRDFTVGKANQTITFDELTDKTYGTPAFALTAQASSGLEVTFSIVSGAATISNNMLTITGIGPIAVLASQAGDANYNAAPGVERNFTVNPIVKFDFNGDQKTDVLFQNERFIGIWYMDGTNFISSALLRNAGPGTANWRVFGMADFTGDNKLDIAFQHFDGRLAIWEMDGDTKVKATIMNNGVGIGLGWRAVSVADMNADNKSDVVFQNKDGRVAVWFMDGLLRQSAALLRGTDALGWRVRGAADITGDFLPDVLVQHTDGRISIWDGADISTTIPLNNGNPVKWAACGLGDFDGDNKTDVLFRSVDNRLAVWIMDGVVRSSAFVLRDGRIVDPKWKVVGPR